MLDTTDNTAIICFQNSWGSEFGGTIQSPISKGLISPLEGSGLTIARLAIKSARETGATRALIIADSLSRQGYLDELARIGDEKDSIPLAFLGAEINNETHDVQQIFNNASFLIQAATNPGKAKEDPTIDIINRDAFYMPTGHRCIYTIGSNPVLKWRDNEPVDLQTLSNSLGLTVFDSNTIFKGSRVEDENEPESKGQRVIGMTSRIGADPKKGPDFFLSRAFTGAANRPENLTEIEKYLRKYFNLGEKTTL